jgi:hypothetical protein
MIKTNPADKDRNWTYHRRFKLSITVADAPYVDGWSSRAKLDGLFWPQYLLADVQVVRGKRSAHRQMVYWAQNENGKYFIQYGMTYFSDTKIGTDKRDAHP